MRQTLERIYREHRQGLFTLALMLTGRAELAEDAVHEAFARLLARGREPEGDPVAYVFASVRNAALDLRLRQARRAGMERSIFGFSWPDAMAGPGDKAERVEEFQRLRRAVEELDRPQREVVVLHALAHLTLAQVGQALDEPAATVATRYRRALEVLRRRMDTSHGRRPGTNAAATAAG